MLSVISSSFSRLRMRSMPDVVFLTPDGLHVVLEEWNWTNHIQPAHPEVLQEDIEHALRSPMRIYDHTSSAKRRVHESAPRTSGAVRYVGLFRRVIVERLSGQAGRVVTAMLTRRSYRGTQRWP